MRLDGAAPLRHDAAVDLPDSLTQLLDDGVIDDVRARLMSGKEAAVWVVERKGELIAAKVYKDREHRSFKATADYVEGRNQTRNSRDKRAMGKRTTYGRELIEAFWPGPLTLVVREQPTLAWDIASSGGHISLRMPLHPVALAVLAATGPLAVTSAQRAGSAPPRTCDAAQDQLGDGIALYLDGGETLAEAPSSIVDLTASPPMLLREGGYSAEVLREVCSDLADPPTT